MPSYDYRCKKCGYTFEGWAKMSAPCPPCGNIIVTLREPPKKGSDVEVCGGETEKVFNGPRPAPQFKGPGWAKDGYSKG